MCAGLSDWAVIFMSKKIITEKPHPEVDFTAGVCVIFEFTLNALCPLATLLNFTFKQMKGLILSVYFCFIQTYKPYNSQMYPE
jgi:hypothetical protein